MGVFVGRWVGQQIVIDNRVEASGGRVQRGAVRARRAETVIARSAATWRSRDARFCTRGRNKRPLQSRDASATDCRSCFGSSVSHSRTRDDAFARAFGGVGQSGRYAIACQRRVLSQQLIGRHTRSEVIQDHGYGDARFCNTRATMHHVWIDRYVLAPVHARSIRRTSTTRVRATQSGAAAPAGDAAQCI